MRHALSPVSELSRVLATHNVAHNARIAIALSGGPDSTALAHILAQWQTHESAEEAAHVANWAASIGLRPLLRRLQWTSTPATKHTMQQARLHRYNALAMLCEEADITHLLVGHHLDDQLHTFVLRMASASGILGLSGMPEASPMQVGTRRITLLRPMLRLRKQALEAYCQRHGLPAVRDPTNADVRFQRNWIGRELLAHCHACGAAMEHCRGDARRPWEPCLVDLMTVMDACADAAAVLKQRALAALDTSTTIEYAPKDATQRDGVGNGVPTLPILPWWRVHPPLVPRIRRFCIDCPLFAAHPPAVQRVAMSVMLQVRCVRKQLQQTRRLLPQALAPPAAPPPSTVVTQRMLQAIGSGHVRTMVHIPPRYMLRAMPGTRGVKAQLVQAG